MPNKKSDCARPYAKTLFTLLIHWGECVQCFHPVQWAITVIVNITTSDVTIINVQSVVDSSHQMLLSEILEHGHKTVALFSGIFLGMMAVLDCGMEPVPGPVPALAHQARRRS